MVKWHVTSLKSFLYCLIPLSIFISFSHLFYYSNVRKNADDRAFSGTKLNLIKLPKNQGKESRDCMRIV